MRLGISELIVILIVVGLPVVFIMGVVKMRKRDRERDLGGQTSPAESRPSQDPRSGGRVRFREMRRLHLIMGALVVYLIWSGLRTASDHTRGEERRELSGAQPAESSQQKDSPLPTQTAENPPKPDAGKRDLQTERDSDTGSSQATQNARVAAAVLKTDTDWDIATAVSTVNACAAVARQGGAGGSATEAICLCAAADMATTVPRARMAGIRGDHRLAKLMIEYMKQCAETARGIGYR